MTGTRLTDEQHLERRVLYDRGMTDREMAAAIGIHFKSVTSWRTKQGLPTNLPPRVITTEQRKAIADLLRKGVGTTVIARELNVDRKRVEKLKTIAIRNGEATPNRPGAWRYPPRTVSGRKYRRLPPERASQAIILYARGYDDATIASAVGVPRTKVCEWRHACRLPLVRRIARKSTARRALGPAITPLSNPLHALIVRAIGRGVAPDIADDTASEIWLAIAEGRLDPAEVEVEAKRYRSCVTKEFANPYGDRSLDEDRGDDDGLRLIDFIRDDRSTDWLEEMGATVW